MIELSSLATAALKQAKIDEAQKYAQLTLTSSENKNHPYFTAKAYYILGELLFLEKEYEKAVEHLNIGLIVTKDIKSLTVEHDIFLLLSKVYYESNDFKNSSLASNQAYVLKDSLFNEEFTENFKNIHLKIAKEKSDEILLTKEAQIEKQRLIN